MLHVELGCTDADVIYFQTSALCQPGVLLSVCVVK